MSEPMMTHDDTRRAPELAELRLVDKPDGPAAAAIMAVGIGVFALGLFTVLSEVWGAFHDFAESLEFDRGVGPLAGKTILAVAAWALTWIILGLAWRRRDASVKVWSTVAVILAILGVLGTFPPIFLSFAAE